MERKEDEKVIGTKGTEKEAGERQHHTKKEEKEKATAKEKVTPKEQAKVESHAGTVNKQDTL